MSRLFNKDFKSLIGPLRRETMNLLLPLTGTALIDCRNHVDRYSETDPAIMAYLTRHVNGLMCAEIESTITRLIHERLVNRCIDTATVNFIASKRKTTIRNATFGEIRGAMKLLGVAYDKKFGDLVRLNVGEEGIERLAMSVGKRNKTAHDIPPDITFGELEDTYKIATQIVDAVRLSLEIKT